MIGTSALLVAWQAIWDMNIPGPDFRDFVADLCESWIKFVNGHICG